MININLIQWKIKNLFLMMTKSGRKRLKEQKIRSNMSGFYFNILNIKPLLESDLPFMTIQFPVTNDYFKTFLKYFCCFCPENKFKKYIFEFISSKKLKTTFFIRLKKSFNIHCKEKNCPYNKSGEGCCDGRWSHFASSCDSKKILEDIQYIYKLIEENNS